MTSVEHRPASPHALTALNSAVAEVAAVLGESPVPVAMTRPGRLWVGLTARHAVYVAHDEAGHFRLMAEAERLLWAAAAGLPVPALVECTASRLVTERAPAHLPVPGTWAQAAVEAARRIPLVAVPPPSRHGAPRPHGGSWLAGAVRAGRLARSPVDVREFHGLRRAVARLPHDRLAHGAFQPRNLLFDSARGAMTLVDWEYLSYQPAQYDLCFLWPRLASPGDRAQVLDAAVAGAADRRALGLLHRWLALRHLADIVTKLPPERWDRERIEAAGERVAEARRNAAGWR